MVRGSLSAAVVLSALMAAPAAMGQQANLRFALADDADALDPHLNRSAVGVAILVAMCDRLVWLDNELNFQPELATDWSWSADNKTLRMNLRRDVKFHDNTPFNAEAVKYNLERAMTLPETQRRDDTAAIDRVAVVSEYTVDIHLKAPNAAQLAKFAERIGMMMSPTAARAAGTNFARNPVCAGPFKFVERVAQDRVVVERFADYWDKANIHLDRVTFRIIPDGTVRLANLQAGDVDVIMRLDPSDATAVERNNRLKLVPIDTLNYESLVINVANTPRGNHPMGRDVRVREAFELALDRKAIVDVAFAGRYVAGNQFVAPGTPYYNPANPMPARNVARARQLLREAGHTAPVPFEILVPNRPLSVRVAEMIQAMTNEAGFDTKLRVVEFATTLNMTDAGDFQAWGPIGPQNANDPDAVTFMSLHTIGSRNVGKYSSPAMDKLMELTRTETDPAKRRIAFQQAAAEMAKDRSLIYLYHQRPLFATNVRVQNIRAAGDGYMLFKGMRMN